jgi:NitT/TauT family transport system substrate-binding protein
MKKKLLLITAFLLILSSCKQESGKIRLGILPVIDTLPLIVADSEGLFKAEGIDVELVVFNSALEKESALTSGGLDGSFGDLITSLLQIKNDTGSKLVIESSHTSKNNRMFALLSSPDSGIDSLDKIGNREVAISMGSIIEFFLDRILVSKGIDPSKIKRVEVKAIPIRMQMLMSNSLNLALIPEPLASKAVKDGAKILADDTDMDTTATVIIFRESFLSKNSDSMKKFFAAYNKSVESINSSPEKYKNLMVEKMRLPADIKDSFRVPVYNNAHLPLEKDVMLVYDWMKSKGMVTKPIDYSKITWSPQK